MKVNVFSILLSFYIVILSAYLLLPATDTSYDSTVLHPYIFAINFDPFHPNSITGLTTFINSLSILRALVIYPLLILVESEG